MGAARSPQSGTHTKNGPARRTGREMNTATPAWGSSRHTTALRCSRHWNVMIPPATSALMRAGARAGCQARPAATLLGRIAYLMVAPMMARTWCFTTPPDRVAASLAGNGERTAPVTCIWSLHLRRRARALLCDLVRARVDSALRRHLVRLVCPPWGQAASKGTRRQGGAAGTCQLPAVLERARYRYGCSRPQFSPDCRGYGSRPGRAAQTHRRSLKELS